METQKIAVSQAKTGMVLATDVYNNSDQMVLNSGTILNDRNITRLKFYAIKEITIRVGKNKENKKENKAPEAPKETTKDTETFIEVLKSSEEFRSFSEGYTSTNAELKKQVMNLIQSPEDFNADTLLNSINEVNSNFHTSSSFFDMLSCIRNYDDAIYCHCLNLAIMCSAFARWLNLSEEEADILILCGLFCDVGKLSIPGTILNKKGALTQDEFKLIREHTIRGYNSLKALPVDPRVAKAALMHHERCDGTGYPKGLKANDIEPFAKIIAILDVYDAMTAARSYRGPICPLEVLSQLQEEGLAKYDPKYLLLFLEKVSSSYLHQDVILSDGRVGQIILLNKNKPASPIIRLSDGTALDLSKTKDVTIVNLV